MKTIRFKDWDCVVEKGKYGNGRPALILNDSRTGKQVAVATVNLPDVEADRNEVFIKDYSENEGMLRALVDARVVMSLCDSIRVGFGEVQRAVLLPPFREKSLDREPPEHNRGRGM